MAKSTQLKTAVDKTWSDLEKLPQPAPGAVADIGSSFTHIFTHKAYKHQNIHIAFPALARWQGPHRDSNVWELSEQLKAVCLAACLSPHQHSAWERRVIEPQTGMMNSRSRSTGFPLKSHYTHKWAMRVSRTDRVSESAATVIRISLCQEDE